VSRVRSDCNPGENPGEKEVSYKDLNVGQLRRVSHQCVLVDLDFRIAEDRRLRPHGCGGQNKEGKQQSSEVGIPWALIERPRKYSAGLSGELG